VSAGKRRSTREAVAEVADKMADAVKYLSRVADEVGMDQISADLLSIRRRLAREAKSSKSSRAAGQAPRTKARSIE
jgi:hypothetical protein